MTDQRLDSLLVSKNLATSRTQAQKMIVAGQVEMQQGSDWVVITKPSTKCNVLTQLRVAPGEEQKFASRAGLKLEYALQKMAINVNGNIALDIGQATGGFTDCLLHYGATKVVGVDVGHDQLLPRLKSDPRVICMEGFNARNLQMDDVIHCVPNGFDVVVMDVAFISQTLIIPRISVLMHAESKLISLVKPQFEVGPQGLAKGGIVKDDSLFNTVQNKITKALINAGFIVEDYFPSPILGADGNREFLLLAQIKN